MCIIFSRNVQLSNILRDIKIHLYIIIHIKKKQVYMKLNNTFRNG